MVTVLALALVTAELAARIATRPRDALMNDTLVGLRDDPLLFWTMEPGYELRMQHGGNVFINSLGLRNEEIDIPKPKGIYRVLSLGESTTFGAFLNVDDTYNKVLQRVLNAEWRHRSPAIDAVEVVNAGMGAYTVWQSYVYVMTRAENLAPDMVLVYHEINDSLPSGVIDAHNFLYRLDTTDRKIYERRRPIAPLLGVLFHSRAYLLLRKWILQLPSDLPEIRVTDRIDRKKGEGAEPRQSNVRPNFIQDWTERYAPRVPRRIAASP
ncbi:MAG: hypothetical protein M5R36_00075 [Deltaproteobacteria bacterium]|nr:hypothetical protein [Deltaproteobacteria bacterium]